MQVSTGDARRPAGGAVAWARALLARFDSAVLRVEPLLPLAPLSGQSRTPAQDAAWAALHQWCFAGAWDAGGRWAVAALDTEQVPGAAALAEAFSRHLDGSDQLAAAGGRVAGLWLRLRVKGQDAQWWRKRRISDPWDAGYLREDPQAWQRFEPRRATLVVSDGLGAPALRDAVRILQARSVGYRHPVRLLVLGSAAEILAASRCADLVTHIT